MIQNLGLLIIVVCINICTFSLSNAERYRINELLQLKKAFLILKGQINRNVLLTDAFLEIADRIENPIKNIFLECVNQMKSNNKESFFYIWTSALQVDKTFLSKNDIENLKSLGNVFSLQDTDLQLKMLDEHNKYIEKTVDELTVLSKKNKKMFQSMGILGSALIVVLFIG